MDSMQNMRSNSKLLERTVGGGKFGDCIIDKKLLSIKLYIYSRLFMRDMI